MSPQRAQQLVEAGLWLRLSGDHEGAKRLFDQALKLDPGNARARQLIESAPGAAAPMSSPPDKPRSNPFARTESPKNPMELDWGLATGFSADEPPPPPPATAARPTIRTIETTPTVHVDADLMPPPVARVPTIAPVTPLEATVAQMADDEEMVELSGFPVEPAFSPDATTDPIAAAVPEDDDEISFSGGDEPPSELPPDPDVDVSFDDLAAETVPPPAAAAEPAVDDISFDEFAGANAAGPGHAPPVADESSFADVSLDDEPPPSLQVPKPQDIVYDDLSIDFDASGITAPPPPAATANGTDDEIDLAGFELEPPPPKPSAGLLPDAQSAWDARANPGISVESVEDAPLELVEPPRPSSPPPAPAKSKQEEARALLQGARDLLELDDHTGAMELIVKAQTLAPEDPEVQAMRDRSEQTLLRMYESKLGDMNQTPTRRLRDDDIIWLNLDHRAGFVLAQIDGTVTYEDVFAVSGMARFDTARILAQLIDQGVIATG